MCLGSVTIDQTVCTGASIVISRSMLSGTMLKPPFRYATNRCGRAYHTPQRYVALGRRRLLHPPDVTPLLDSHGDLQGRAAAGERALLWRHRGVRLAPDHEPL